MVLTKVVKESSGGNSNIGNGNHDTRPKKVSTPKTQETTVHEKTHNVSSSKVLEISQSVEQIIQNGVKTTLVEKSISVDTHKRKLNGEDEESMLKVQKIELKTTQVSNNTIPLQDKKDVVKVVKPTTHLVPRALAVKVDFYDQREHILKEIGVLSTTLTLGWKRPFFDYAIGIIKSNVEESENWEQLKKVLMECQDDLPGYRERLDKSQHHIIDKYSVDLETFLRIQGGK